MDMTLNRISDDVRNIHLTAVCGTGMAALASMLKELGYQVTGSDQNVYPPMSTFLANQGIEVLKGYVPDNVAYGPDLVVIGNAVSKDNPEVVAVDQMGLDFCSMPQALNHFVARDKKSLLVTGTHGKTTTSSLLAWILETAGLDPTFMIGGIVKNFNSNYKLGNGEFIVIEGDEYDTAFFDKGPKFLHYKPYRAILTSVEFDHADIYRDLDHVKSAFDRFIGNIPDQSHLVVYDDDINIAGLIQSRSCVIQHYGKKQTSDYRLTSHTIDPPWTVFKVVNEKAGSIQFKTRMMGEHNLLNALATIAVARSIGISDDKIDQALQTFEGVKRRQEIRGVKNGITIMDDFAHHPTAVKETIRAVRPFCHQGRLIAVFEPRTNTSMRAVFQTVYSSVFDQADLICIRKPPLLSKIPENNRFSSEKLVNDLQSRGKQAVYFDNTDDIIAYLKITAHAGDCLLIMSNGGFDNIHKRLLDEL